MTPLRRILSRLAREERGFSMLVVMGLLSISAVFIAAGFAAADGDIPITQNAKDRKRAYAAAEAGLEFYRYHLAQDNDYWTHCDNVPGPAPGVPAPVTQAGAANRNWRALPGSNANYTVEILPASGYSACVEGDERTVLDRATGTFRIRASGRAGNITRSIVATFRRKSFLDYLYFSDYETTDPINYNGAANQLYAQTFCAERYRAARSGLCREIQWAEPDAMRGPMHTNDDFLVCNRPIFGRDSNDVVEVSGPAPGYDKVCNNVEPTINGVFRADVDRLTMPASNGSLAAVAPAQHTYTGTTTFRLNANGTYDVRTADGTWTYGKAWPGTGVIYVNSGPNCVANDPPSMAGYDETADCAIAYVSGTYSRNLTIGSAGDIVVRPPAGSSNGNIERQGDVLLGLIANNFVRVSHKVDRSMPGADYNTCANVDTAADPLMRDVRIDAAILALEHSFTADNYACGGRLGNLTVNGAIAQVYRGAVATSGNTGFVKDYNYDDRLRYRSPPYFLTPVDAAWVVNRTNEQVPAAR